MLGVRPERPDARLRERRVPFSGLTSSEIEVVAPGMLDGWRRGTLVDLPGAGEPWAAFVDRVHAGLRDHGRRPGTTLVIAHAGVFRVIEHLTGATHRRHANGEGLALRVAGGRLVAAARDAAQAGRWDRRASTRSSRATPVPTAAAASERAPSPAGSRASSSTSDAGSHRA